MMIQFNTVCDDRTQKPKSPSHGDGMR